MFKLIKALKKQLSTFLDESNANAASSVVLGVVGATLFFAPDYFWNPEDGVLPIPQLVTDEALDHHFDAPTKIRFRASGAVMLGAALYHMFFLNDGEKGAEERAFLRYKMGLFASHSVIMLHTAFYIPYTEIFFDQKLLIILAFIKSCFVLWLGVALARSEHPREPIMKEFSSGSLALLLSMAYYIPYAVMLIWTPDIFSAHGALHYYVERPSSLLASAYDISDKTSGFNIMQTFTSRYAGASFLPYLTFLLDLFTVPLHVVQLIMVGMCLIVAVIITALTDPSGVASKKAYGMALLVHSLVLFAVWKLAHSKKAKPNSTTKLYRPEEKLVSESKKAVKGKAASVPPLAQEKGHQKVQ